MTIRKTLCIYYTAALTEAQLARYMAANGNRPLPDVTVNGVVFQAEQWLVRYPDKKPRTRSVPGYKR